MEILFLSQIDVSSLLTMVDTIDAVESAFREKGLGHVQMPAKVYIYYKEHNGDLRVMPSYLEGSNKSGMKVVNVHPNNPISKGLPTIMAIIMLIDPSTGAPLAIMDGTLITALRTGAAGGVATKYLARKDSRVLSLIGAGRQAVSQLEAISEVVSISEVNVCDRNKELAQQFINKVEGQYAFDFTAMNSVEACIETSDIISTITPSRKPIVEDKWVKNGIHINAIGADAPGKQELDPNILKRSKIIVDDLEQACHSGEVNMSISQGILNQKDIYGELGEIVCKTRKGRESDDEITVFDSTGLAIQDIVTAWIVYEKAKKKNLGTWLTLF